MRDKVVRRFAEKNTLITPEAWEYLNKVDHFEDVSEVIEKFEEENGDLPFPVCKETVTCFTNELLDEEEKKEKRPLEPESDKAELEMDDVDVLKDISGESTCTGNLEDFKKYFHNRFEKIRSIIKERRDGKKARPIRRVAGRSGEATVIGMVRDVFTSANDNKMLTLEDESGEIRGFISTDSEVYDKDILEDEVILARGEVWESNEGYDETLNIEDIIRPGIPKLNDRSRPTLSGKIAFLGDVHIGSKNFLKDEWDDFVSWINSDDEVAEAIEYLVIPGDLIDGIGIFPGQEEELDIIDIYEQYRKFADMIEELPQDVTVITIPGNHDIVRNAEPQPCLPEEIRNMFPDNVLFYGNPALVDLQGLKILIYHGSSINDLSDMLPQVDSDHPLTAMKEMLKRRHLVPVYGQGTSIAPEEDDHLVIEEVPDIFVTGHVHQTEVADHHDIIMVNSSTWQAQTEYQKMRDIEPDPAKVIVLDTNTNEVSIRDFT